MSDQSPPPKPKPGSLRDRIAAFENKGGAPSPAGPPLPRPKPGGVQWKPRPPSPTSPDSTQSSERKPPSTGGMSASDAMESIGRGGSLKERMAALQGKGAFGGPPPPIAPKPNVERPKWKPPLSTPSACPEDEGTADVGTTARETSRSPPPRAMASPASAEVYGSSNHDDDVGTQDGNGGDLGPEEEERQRRAAIAARMARLGGARLGMAAPIFAPKPVMRKPEPASGPQINDESHGDQPVVPKESDQALATLSHDIPVATSLAPHAVTDEPESPLPAPARAPTSMPVPAGPRRAAPPRKKASKNAPTTALPEPPVEEVVDMIVPTSSVINEPPAGADHIIQEVSTTTGDSQEIAEQVEAVQATLDESQQSAPINAFHESFDKPEKQEAEEGLLEDAGSYVEGESMRTATGEQDMLSEQPHDEDEDVDEEARHQRVAAKLAQMGAFNPLAGPPPMPSRQFFEEPDLAPPEAPLDVEDKVNIDTEEYGETISHTIPPRHDAVHIVNHDATEPCVETDQGDTHAGEGDQAMRHRDGERAATPDLEEQGDGHDGRSSPTPEDQPIGTNSVLGVARQVQSTASTPIVDISGTAPLGSERGDSGNLSVSVSSTTAAIEYYASKAETDGVPPLRGTRPTAPPPVNLRSKPTPPSSPPISPPPKTPSQALRVEEVECPPSPDIPPRPVPPPGRSGSMTENSPSPPPRRSIPPPPRRTSSVRVTEVVGGTSAPPPPVPISPRPVGRRPDTPPIITTLVVQEPETLEEHKTEHVTEEDASENVTPRPETPEDEESARRRAIAERMARLGGIRFGGPPLMNPLSRPPLPAAPPPTSIPPDDMEEGKEEEVPRIGGEEEAARKQRITAKLEGMGGMRIGTFLPPSGLPPASSRRIVTRQEDSESEDTLPPVPIPAPPQRPPPARKLPPPMDMTVEEAAEPDGRETLKVETAESPVEERQYADTEDVPALPPPHKSPQTAQSAEVLPTPPPRTASRSPSLGRPPIPAIPTVLLGRRSSTMAVSSSRQTSLDEPGPGEAPTIPRPPSEYVMVEPEEQDGDEPPVMPSSLRHKLTRGGSTRLIPALPPVPPPSAIDPPEALTSGTQWELPPIPQGVEFGDMSEMGSLRWSEDSTAVHVPAPPSSSSHTASRSASVKVGLPSSSMSVSTASGSGSGRRSLDQQPQLTTDELMAIWGKTGVRVVEAATALFEKSRRTLVGDGSHAGFVRAVLAQVSGVAYPTGMPGTDDSDWGYVVYAQTGNAVQRRVSDIMPGDVVAFWDARLKGHKGLHAYTQTVGMTTPEGGTGGGPLVGIVNEFDGKKSKVRVWQANQHVGQQVSRTNSSLSVFRRLARVKSGVLTPRATQTVENVSYRLDDLKSGQVKVFRVLEA